MVRPPWELTREMFLSEQEVVTLTRMLHAQVNSASRGERDSFATDELIIQCLVFSGMRNSEFCGLRVRDTGGSVFRIHGTRRQDRNIHVPDSVDALARRYVRNTRTRLTPAGIDPDDQSQPLVFNERGRPYERTGLYRRVVRILQAAGFGDRASVQLLRHTYGCLGYRRSGGNLLFLQRQLGHAHPMITKVYAEFVEEDYAGLANLIGGIPGDSFDR